MVVTMATEGTVDTAIARRILGDLGLESGAVHGEKGKNWLDRNLRGYNNAARFAPWLVLRDLDRDAECAPELLASLLPFSSEDDAVSYRGSRSGGMAHGRLRTNGNIPPSSKSEDPSGPRCPCGCEANGC